LSLKIVIVGGGRVGSRLATILQKEGNKVIVIEKDKERAEEIANLNPEITVINSDIFDKSVYKDVFEEGVDIFIAATSDDQTNMLACEIAKRRGVQKTIARVVDPDLYEIFLELDITPVNETLAVIENIKRHIHITEKEHVVTQIGGDRAVIIRKIVKEDSEIIGKNIKEAKLMKYLICIDRNGEIIYPEEKSVIEAGDILYVISTYEDLDYVKELLR